MPDSEPEGERVVMTDGYPDQFSAHARPMLSVVEPGDPEGPKDEKPTVGERLGVALSNFKARKVQKGYQAITRAMKADPAYAFSWWANIAQTVQDHSGLPDDASAKVADGLMLQLFGLERRVKENPFQK